MPNQTFVIQRSDTSDDVSEYEFPSNNCSVNVPLRRQYRAELDKLNVNFPLPRTKTRSGCV